MSLSSRNALEQYPGYHLVCRGEIPVKGKGTMRTYFLCGKDGFTKELPKWEEYNEHEMRVSQTSLNSMASMMSSPSTCYSFVPSNFGQTPKTSQVSDSSTVTYTSQLSNESKTSQDFVANVSNVSHNEQVPQNSQGAEWDKRYSSKQTNILEVTCF